MVAHHASPGTRARTARDRRGASPQTPALTHARSTSRPRWLPGGNLQTIWPALFAPALPTAPLPALPARALGHARRRLHRRRLRRRPATRGAPLLVLFHGLEGSSREPLCRGLRGLRARARLALRGAALPRLLGRAQPRAARLPLGRLRRDRLDPRRACARSMPGAAAGGRRLARRQCAAALGRGGRRRAPRSAVRRAWPRSRAPLDLAAGGARDRPRLQPAGLHAHVPATMKPKALAKLAQHPGLFDRERAARGARPVRASTTCSPRRCTAFATPTTTGARGSAKPHLHAHPHSGAGAQRTQRPVRAGRPACRARTRSARTSRCGSRRTAATWASPAARSPGHVRGHARARWWAGWRSTR